VPSPSAETCTTCGIIGHTRIAGLPVHSRLNPLRLPQPPIQPRPTSPVPIQHLLVPSSSRTRLGPGPSDNSILTLLQSLPSASSLGDGKWDDVDFLEPATSSPGFQLSSDFRQDIFGDGVCYLALFPPSHRGTAATRLSINPSLAAVLTLLRLVRSDLPAGGLHLPICQNSDGSWHVDGSNGLVDVDRIADLSAPLGCLDRRPMVRRTAASRVRSQVKYIPHHSRPGFCWSRSLPSHLTTSERLRVLVELGAYPSSDLLRLYFSARNWQAKGSLILNPDLTFHVKAHSRLLTFPDINLPVGSSQSSRTAWDTVPASNYKDSYMGQISAQLNASLGEASLICPFMLDKHQAEYLDQFGIPHQSDASKRHAHAEFKAVENYFLYLDLPNRLKGNVLFCSIKEFKVKMILERAKASGPDLTNMDFSKSNINSFSIANPLITAADQARYSRELLFPHPSVFSPTTIVLCDSLHYNNADHVAWLYEYYPSLESIFAIMNIPAELKYLADSLYPRNYTLSYVGETDNAHFADVPSKAREACTNFTFHFTQNKGTTYEQPISCIDWLETKEICSTLGLSCGVERLLSIGPQHLFVLTRNLPVLDTERFVHQPDVAKLPRLHANDLELTQPFISLKVYRQVLLHAESFSRYEKIDTVAKSRTYASQDTTISSATLHSLIRITQFYRSHYDPRDPQLIPAFLQPLWDLLHFCIKFLCDRLGRVGRYLYNYVYYDRILMNRLISIAHQDAYLFRFKLVSRMVHPRPSIYFKRSGPSVPCIFKPVDLTLPTSPCSTQTIIRPNMNGISMMNLHPLTEDPGFHFTPPPSQKYTPPTSIIQIEVPDIHPSKGKEIARPPPLISCPEANPPHWQERELDQCFEPGCLHRQADTGFNANLCWCHFKPYLKLTDPSKFDDMWPLELRSPSISTLDPLDFPTGPAAQLIQEQHGVHLDDSTLSEPAEISMRRVKLPKRASSLSPHSAIKHQRLLEDPYSDDVSPQPLTPPSPQIEFLPPSPKKHSACRNKKCTQHTNPGPMWKSCQANHGFNPRTRADQLCHICISMNKLPLAHGLVKDTDAPGDPRRNYPRPHPPGPIKGDAFRSTVPGLPLTGVPPVRLAPSFSRPRGIPFSGSTRIPLPAPREEAPNTPYLPQLQVQTLYTGTQDDCVLTGRLNSDTLLPVTKLEGTRCVNAPYPAGRDCLLRALEALFDIDRSQLWNRLCMITPAIMLHKAYIGSGLDTYHAHLLAMHYGWCIALKYPTGGTNRFPAVGMKFEQATRTGQLEWTPTRTGGHFEATKGVHPIYAFNFSFALTDTMQHVAGTGYGPKEKFLRDVLPLFDSVPGFVWKSWTPSRERAKAFWNAYRAREVGIMFKDGFCDLEASSPSEITRDLEFWQPKPINLSVIEGLPGSGKSRPIIERLKSSLQHLHVGLFSFGFPRVFLRTDTVKKFPNIKKHQKDMFRTWEHVLANDALLSIMDEFTLFPPGYFDFLCFNVRQLEYLILLGDCTQGNWAPESEHARAHSSLMSLPTNKSYFHSFVDNYRYYTYRMPQRLALPFSVHTFSQTPGWVDFQFHMPPVTCRYPILCASDTIKGACIREGYAAYTYTEVQGAEFPVVVFRLSTTTLRACPLESIWTALTRTTDGLIIQCDLDPTELSLLTRHPIFGPLLDYCPATHIASIFQSYFPTTISLNLPFGLHHSSGTGVTRPSEALSYWSNARLDFLPASFRANAPVIYDCLSDDPSFSDPSCPEDRVNTHLPASCDPRNYAEEEPVLPREDRELFYQGEMSAQFIEYNAHGSLPSLSTLFPKQTAAKDPTLFLSAIKTRFDYATAEENEKDYEHKRWLGPLLFERFRRLLRLPDDSIPFEEERYVLAQIQTIAVKLDKPINTIWNNIDRSEPEWPSNFMHAFVKSQAKAKAETSARSFRLSEDDEALPLKPEAKPGQPLVTSPDINIWRFGAWTRYMRSLLYDLMPKHIYIHGGKTLKQMDAWSREFSNDNDVSTCDFTKYDMSCKAETLSFELSLFSYFQMDLYFPDSVLEYFFIKTNMYTQLGTSAIMRFTGEFGTYDFNSWYNIAYMAFRFRLDENTSFGCAFSGDDSLFFGRLIERDDWCYFERQFALVGKYYYGPSKDFCGWWLLPCGIVRNPILLVLKIMYHQGRNHLSACLDSYFLEALYAYNCGDLLYDHVPPLALEAQHWIIDFCFKHSKLVPHLSIIAGSAYTVSSDSTYLTTRILKMLMPRLSILSFSTLSLIA
jgi:hypothetical protein